MDFEVSGSGEVPNPTRPEQWDPWEPKLPPGDAHNFETGCLPMQERLRCLEEQLFDFLLEFFYFIRHEICDRFYGSWEENQLKNGFHEVCNAAPFPKEKTREALPGPPPLIPPFPVEMLRLNWLRRSRKVFWKQQNRPNYGSGPKEH